MKAENSADVSGPRTSRSICGCVSEQHLHRAEDIFDGNLRSTLMLVVRMSEMRDYKDVNLMMLIKLNKSFLWLSKKIDFWVFFVFFFVTIYYLLGNFIESILHS